MEHKLEQLALTATKVHAGKADAIAVKPKRISSKLEPSQALQAVREVAL